MNFEKIRLPYEYDSLEPYIDALTVETHYEKHLDTYVKNLNRFFIGYENFIGSKTLEEILCNIDDVPMEIRQQVKNNGGGVVNHNFYFNILSPYGKREPEGDLLYKIQEGYGSFNNLREAVSRAAIGHFGSGWSWLVINQMGNLEVITTANQDSPLSLGYKPLLTIDVWEHAYYLKYKNLRVEYVNNIWNLFDWDKIEKIYKKGIV